ncbi:TraC family protein [Bdellovibrionota bacterium FG-1]
MKSLKEKLPRPIQEALAKQDIFVKALFTRPESLSALLPYDEYIAESGIFRNKDGSLGVVFEVSLLEHEPMGVDAVRASVESLKTWFNLPTQCTLQILFDQANISALDLLFDDIERYYPTPHPVSQALFSRRIGNLKAACNADQKLTPLARRALVSIRYFPEGRGLRLGLKFVKRSESILHREMKSFVRESRHFSQIIADFQHNSKVPLRILNAQELLDVLRRFFNPKTYYKRSFAKYNPNVMLSEQILYNNPTLDYAGIECEGIKTRTLSLKTSPQFAYPGGMAYFTKLPFPFKLSINVTFPTKRQVKTFFDMKEFFLQNTPSARARRQREEVMVVQERLAREDRCLHATITVTIEGATDGELESRVREVVNLFNNNLECETVLEDDIGLGLCLNTLPLNYIAKSDYSSQRFIRILRSDLVNFVPIFDSFRGTKKPLGLYLSRERNLVRFSTLENQTSNHTVVLADSGSGKSAFIIDCIQNAKRMTPEPLVFVIDKKSSSVMLSECFDGDLTIFDRDKEMPFSPFRGVYDEEKFSFLAKLLECGIKLTSSHFEFDSLHGSAIHQSLRLAYEKKVKEAGLAYVDGELLKQNSAATEVVLTMDDLIVELAALPSVKGFESFGSVVDALTQRLMPFYGNGDYAKYFRGSAKRRSGKRPLLYVYDLDALETDPTLQALMTMAVFEEVRRIRKLPENENRMSFVILEELGMLGRNNPTAGPFIVDFAETGRKLDMWLFSLTPRPQNYFELEAGRAMWSVADNFLFLQMGADNIKYLKEHSDLIDEASSQIIGSLRTVLGEYADVFYMNKKKTWCGAFRFIQTGLDRWLCPSNAKDSREAGRALKQFKGAKWQALEYLAARFPQGVEKFEEAQNEERMRTHDKSHVQT